MATKRLQLRTEIVPDLDGNEWQLSTTIMYGRTPFDAIRVTLNRNGVKSVFRGDIPAPIMRARLDVLLHHEEHIFEEAIKWCKSTYNDMQGLL